MTMLSRAPLTPVALAFALVAVIPRAEAQGTRSDSAAILAVIFPERSNAITGQEAIKRFIDGRRREPAGWRMQLDMWNSGPKSGSP